MIVNTHDVTIASQQAILGKNNCMEVQLYAFHYMTVPLSRELDKADAISNVLGFKPFLWLDFEGGSVDVQPDPSVDVMLGWIARAIYQATSRGYNVGIYTNRNWWTGYAGNELFWFANGMPLWDANWIDEDVTEFDPASFTPYGGLNKPAMWQHKGAYDLEGVDVGVSFY